MSEFEFHPGRGWLTSETALVRRINRNDANGYYRSLGLNPDATRDEIKAAYAEMESADPAEKTTAGKTGKAGNECSLED